MLFSFNKLKTMANLKSDITPQMMTDALTSLGFEVENVNKFTNVEGLKFGKVLKIEKNPNADNLNVCEIQFDDKVRIIQTNATNVEKDMVVIAFVPGAKVGDITFEAKELRGVISEGMLSSPSEFGINKEYIRTNIRTGITRYDGIEDLSIDPIEYLGLNDYIIEVDILTNRSDANSYYVIALELAAKFKTQINFPEIKKGLLESKITTSSNELVLLEADTNFNINIKEQIFLAKHQIQSTDNYSDLANLSFLYSGQPIQIYDGEKVGNNFEVSSHTGEVIASNNKQLQLEDDLVVKADNQVISLASIIGLKSSQASNDSKNIKIELGIFNTKKIRKTVKSAKINTTFSSQGSKKLSRGTTDFALRYLTNKLTSFSNPINWNTSEMKKVNFDIQKLISLAGYDITNEEEYKQAIKSMETLGFIFQDKTIQIPSYRHDIDNSEDLIEEIFRFYGYENFKPTKPAVAPSHISDLHHYAKEFVAMGYQQIKTYTLISENKNIFNPFNFDSNIKLETFVSKEREVIRNSQAIPMLEVATYNYKRGMKEFSLYSEGMINNGIKTAALLSNKKSFNSMKQEILRYNHSFVFKRSSDHNLHPGVSADILLDNQKVGWIGKVHPRLTDIDAYICEIKVDALTLNDVAYKDYNDAPLKFEDITIPLNNQEEIGPKIQEYKDSFSVKVIDRYKDEDKNKITIRVIK